MRLESAEQKTHERFRRTKGAKNKISIKKSWPKRKGREETKNQTPEKGPKSKENDITNEQLIHTLAFQEAGNRIS